MRLMDLVCPSGYDCTLTVQHYANDPVYLLGFFAWGVGVLLALAVVILAFGKAWAWTHPRR